MNINVTCISAFAGVLGVALFAVACRQKELATYFEQHWTKGAVLNWLLSLCGRKEAVADAPAPATGTANDKHTVAQAQALPQPQSQSQSQPQLQLQPQPPPAAAAAAATATATATAVAAAAAAGRTSSPRHSKTPSKANTSAMYTPPPRRAVSRRHGAANRVEFAGSYYVDVGGDGDEPPQSPRSVLSSDRGGASPPDSTYSGAVSALETPARLNRAPSTASTAAPPSVNVVSGGGAKPAAIGAEADEARSDYLEDILSWHSIDGADESQSVEYKDLIAKYPHLQSRALNFALILTSSGVLYNVVYTALAIIGLAFPLLYCFHLFGILTAFGTLRNVVRAVRDTWRQLLQTALLVLFVIYCYAVIAFVYFRQYFVTADNELACNTLSACLYFTLEWGLLNGGGVGNSVGSASLEVPNWNYVRQVQLMLVHSLDGPCRCKRLRSHGFVRAARSFIDQRACDCVTVGRWRTMCRSLR